MKYKFSKLVDISESEKLIESFSSMTGINFWISEKDCEAPCIDKANMDSFDFNKIISIDNFRCYGAENHIVSQINEGRNYGIYKCENGLVYFGAPVIIDGEHISTIFAGYIFNREPDLEYFKNQARTLKLDENKYIKALKEIPVVSEEEILKIIDFLSNGVKILGKLEKMAYYDAITKLPNINLFKKELENQINHNKRFSVFHVDLNNFKNVNDTFGSVYGDNLLKSIGKAIRSELGKDITVARANGDVFLILQSNIIEKKQVVNTAEKILEIVNGLWKIDEKESFITCRIGITIYPDDGDNIAMILGNADIAVDKIKHDNKNLYKFFESSMYDEILRKTELEKELRKAVRNHEFTLYYQPQVSVQTKKVVSFEALIRWNNKKLGWVSPKEFISLAEETGLIIPIGEWVLRTACIQNKEWKGKGYSYDFISVNISAIELQKSDFVSIVKDILKETGTDPESLEIEITESVMMESIELNLDVLNELKSIGIRVALDDFGTGYSSLNYLKSLPINTLKIDKTFIDGLCKSSYEEIITEQIIDLAHKMGLEVVAEGVELEEQLKSLEGKNCNKIQGYYFARPLPPENIKDFFENNTLDNNTRIVR